MNSYSTETITVKRRWPLWRLQGNQHNRTVKWFWKWDSTRDYYLLVAYDNLRFGGTTIIDTPGGTTVIGPSNA